MPKSIPETFLGGKWGRCKNCKRRFPKTRDDKLFCCDKCRHEYNNYGRTPQAQMEGRLKSFLKTPAFRKLLNEAIKKELRAMREDLSKPMPSATPESRTTETAYRNPDQGDPSKLPTR
jgi:ribosomal protein L37AE/L43A